MTDRDRLIELLLKCDKENDVLSCFNERPRKKQSAEIIADYLIANGAICPPCKVGDTVYYITGIGHNLIKSAKIKEIIMGENGITDLYVQGDGHNFENSFDIFFLTCEEAEKALERSNGND